MFYFVVLDVMFCFFNIFSVRALELSGVRSQTIMSQKLDVFSNSSFCIFLVRAMKFGRSVSDHVPQADHTHCVLDITRKEYMYILDGVCCGRATRVL